MLQNACNSASLWQIVVVFQIFIYLNTISIYYDELSVKKCPKYYFARIFVKPVIRTCLSVNRPIRREQSSFLDSKSILIEGSKFRFADIFKTIESSFQFQIRSSMKESLQVRTQKHFFSSTEKKSGCGY